MTALGQAAARQKSEALFEKRIDALLKSIGGVEKSRGPRGPMDYSSLHKEYRRDKDGVVRGRWVSNGKRQTKQNGGKTKNNAKPLTARDRSKKIIGKWIRKDNIERAKGMTRDEIFAAFSRSREPVAFLNKQTRQLLGAKTRSVLSSEAYFVDHAVNHHPEMQPKEFLKMQEVLESPDEIVRDTKGDIKGDTFGFIKNNGDKKLVVFLRKDGDTFVFYRTMYLQTGRLSSRYQKISLAKSQGLCRPGTGTSRYESSRSPASSPLISGLVGKDTLPQTDSPVNKNSKKVKKSKKWLWIDSNGKIWVRKSVLEAWRREMAGGL